MKNKELTKAELQLMQILWKKEKAFVNDILDSMQEPKPAYNTVSTIMRILVAKGFVSYKAYGRTHRYYPMITEKDYTNNFMTGVKNTLFGGSFTSMLSFFAQREKLSEREREDILDILNRTRKETEENKLK